MLIIQFTGLSGAGKTTLAQKVNDLFEAQQIHVEVIDGDVYRTTLCKDLGFSKADRCENIRRLGKEASELAKNSDITIIAAINPYEEIRNELKVNYNAKTVWIKCAVEILSQRDTKGLYKRARLPEGHPQKISNLTGFNDVYENPTQPDLIIDTALETPEISAGKLFRFLQQFLY